MRGKSIQQVSMLSLKTPDQRVPKNHPLRAVKELADEALKKMSPVFDAMYSSRGRQSIPPERLLKATLLMAFHSVRSERLFCDQLDYNLLFRWFLDMSIDEPSFDHSTFSFNRERLLKQRVAEEFFAIVVGQANEMGLTSNEHFSADGTLIQALASLKSFQEKSVEEESKTEVAKAHTSRNPDVDFHGEKRRNDTHESTTDNEARLATKSSKQSAQMSYSMNGISENRNGILVAMCVMIATGTAERNAASTMLSVMGGEGRITLGADKAYDTQEFVSDCRNMNVTPHVAQKKYSAIDRRTTSQSGYDISQRRRKIIEEIWAWMKTVGGMKKSRFIGRERTENAAYFVGAAYNLLRIAKLSQ
jgi:transposase